MDLYNKLLNQQKEEKEIQRLKQNKRSLDYYYKNREYILNRQAQKKLLHPNYYKEWYEKNKKELNEKRRENRGAIKRINTTYNKNSNNKYTPYNNKKEEKEFSFILFN